MERSHDQAVSVCTKLFHQMGLYNFKPIERFFVQFNNAAIGAESIDSHDNPDSEDGSISPAERNRILCSVEDAERELAEVKGMVS